VFREAGTQVSLVTMSCPSLWLHPVCCYERPLKEEEGLLGLLLLGALLWAFGLFALGGFFAFEYWEEAFGREKNC
jgi:hypothetical protein